jgi:nitrite reductase/ring-hydroxylating ferredoxin subunit
MDPMSKLENAKALDRLTGPVQKVVRRVLRPGPVRDALHGVWLGHPLHPALVQVPTGAWLSASLLDLFPGNAAASRRLTAVGLAAAAPTAWAGWADWSETHEQQMRVGLVHVAANVAAIGAYSVSLSAPPARARLLRLAGLTLMGAGGYLGAHIAYRLSSGANHTESVPHLIEPGWHDLVAVAELPDRRPVRHVLGEVPVVVVREWETIRVLPGRCSHLSGPLWEGEFRDGCLTCPWHGSTFRIADGSVVRGPATAPLPSFQVRVTDGIVQVCLPGAG